MDSREKKKTEDALTTVIGDNSHGYPGGNSGSDNCSLPDGSGYQSR